MLLIASNAYSKDAQITKLINELREDNDTYNQIKAADELVELGSYAVNDLIAALKNSKDPYIRIGVAKILGEIQDIRAVEPLIAALKTEKLDDPRVAVESALASLKDSRAIQPLVKNLKNCKSNLNAASALSDFGVAAVEPSIQVMKDKDPFVRRCAVLVLKFVSDNKALLPLISALKDDFALVRTDAAWALGDLKDNRAIKPLIESLADPEREVRINAARSLRMIGVPEAEVIINRSVSSTCIEDLQKPNSETRQRAAVCLGYIKETKAVESLMTALNDSVPMVRARAQWALAEIDPSEKTFMRALNSPHTDVRANTVLSKDSRMVPFLINALKDNNWRVRWNASWSLGELRVTEAIQPLIGLLHEYNIDETDIPGDCFGRKVAEPSQLLTVGMNAALALVKIGTAAVEPLIAVLEKSDQTSKMHAIWALGRLQDPRAITSISNALLTEGIGTYGIRQESAIALGLTKDARGVEPLFKLLDTEEDTMLRSFAEDSLRKIGKPTLVYLIAKQSSGKLLLADDKWIKDVNVPIKTSVLIDSLIHGAYDFEQQIAAELIGEQKEHEAVPYLISALKQESTRNDAAIALRKISNENFGKNYKLWKTWWKMKSSTNSK